MPRKILVIDDEPQMVMMVSGRLKVSGYTALGATSGKQGLEVAKKEKPDLIFLDYWMPEMDGTQVLEAMQRDFDLCNIPVIMLTANLKKDDAEKCKQKGAVDCLYKPFSPNDLVNKIRKAFGEGM